MPKLILISCSCYTIVIFENRDSIVFSVCTNNSICDMVLQTWNTFKKGTRGLLPPFIDVDGIVHMSMMFVHVHPDAIIF